MLRNAIPRKKKEVVPVRTGKIALYSSPFRLGFKYADLFKNTRNLDEMQYEVLLRCNGDFTIEEIAERWGRLFDYEYKDALLYVVNALYQFERTEIIHELPALAEFNELLPEPYQPLAEQPVAMAAKVSGNGHSAVVNGHAQQTNGHSNGNSQGEFIPLSNLQIPTQA